MGSLANYRTAGAPAALAKLAVALQDSMTALPAAQREQESRFVVLLTSVLEQEVPLTFHYQPIVDLQRATAVGYEGLVRFSGDLPWSPDRWFTAAERYGLRLELEALVTASLLARRSLLPENTFLSINTSPSFILSPLWDDLVSAAGDLKRIAIEITENEAVADYGPLLEKIRAIRAAGGTVAVDDAGSGYASLHHIMELKPEFVKLDRVFVSECHRDRAKSVLIEMVGRAAGRLDAWVIAEGVETEAELAELSSLRVPLAQGYFLARPAPAMASIADEPAEAIARRASTAAMARTMATVTEPCPAYPDLRTARAVVECDPGHGVAVLVDQWQRPLAVVERHPLVGIRVLQSPMRMQASTPAAEALDRAMLRPPGQCYDPVVAIDELGVLTGVARVERLVRQVLAGD